MINERKMITILVGTFMVTMVGLLIWTYKKPANVSSWSDQTSENENFRKPGEGTVEDKFSSAVQDTENRIAKSINDAALRKEQSTGINLEPGTVL